MKTTTPRIFASYARCSTDDQAEGDYSTIDAQHALNRERVAALGGEIRHTISDEGRTGTDLKRPGWKQLLELARTKQIDAVIVTYMSRLGRGDAFVVARYLLSESGTGVEMVQEKFTQDLAGRMQQRTQIFLDGLYAEQVSHWTRTKQAAMVAAGYWTGGRPRFGYRTEPAPGMVDQVLPGGKVKRAPRVLVPEDGQAAVVREAFALFAITGILADAQKLLRERSSVRRWTPAEVRTLLTDDLYLGVHRFGKHVKIGSHGPLIDRETFDSVQARLSATAPMIGKPQVLGKTARGERHGLWYLRGRVWCSCGRPMTPSWAKGATGEVLYYQCTDPKACAVKRINATRLHEGIVELLAWIGGHPSRMERALTAARAKMEEGRDGDADVAVARKALREASREVSRLVSALKAAGSSRALVAAIQEAEEKELAAEKRLMEAQARREQLRLPRPDVRSLAALWGRLALLWQEATHAERTELFGLLVDRVDLQAKGKGRIAIRLIGSQSVPESFDSTHSLGAAFAVAPNNPSPRLEFDLDLRRRRDRSRTHAGT